MSRLLLFATLLFSNFVYSQDLSVGLRAYYPFNGNANDASGNNNNPGFNNATLTNDKDGNANSAYHFNGIDNYIRIPNSVTLNTTTQLSLCAWVNVSGFYTGTCHGNELIMKGDNDGLSGDYMLRFSENFYANGTNCANPVTDILHQNFYGIGTTTPVPGYTPYIQPGDWYAVVYTYDGTVAKLYMNCELKMSNTISISTFTNTYDLFLGKMNHPSYPYWLNGDLDEIRIYDRALTQDEVNLYSGCAVAPVTLLDFTATIPGKKSIRLDWKTENESGMKEFQVQRKELNSTDFTIVEKVIPHNNTSVQNAYTITDHTAVPNINYQYRLAMIDIDGSKKYSHIKNARINNDNFFITVINNPVKDVLQLRAYNCNGPAMISIYNATGQVVKQKQMILNNGLSNDFSVNDLPNGYYWMIVQTNSETTTQKILIANR